MFVLAIMVQLLLICLSSQLVSLAEKIDHLFRKGDKLNLGLAALVLILAEYSYFWAHDEQPWRQLDVRSTPVR